MSDLDPLSDSDAVEAVLADASPATRDGLLVALASQRGRSTAEIAALTGLSSDAVEQWIEALDVEAPPAETDGTDDGSDDEFDRSRCEVVDAAVRSFVKSETTDGIAEPVTDAADEFFGTTAVVVYRYDGLRSELVPEVVTPAADARFEIEPIAEGRDPWWSAFRSDDPTTVGTTELVVPSETLGIVRLGGIDADAVTEIDVQTFRPIATAAIGAIERRRRVRTLEDDRAELKKKNEDLQDFANIVSHDLRNPLSVAEGYLELAVETGDEEYVREIKDAHKRIDRIIEHTLTLARQGQGIDDAEAVDLESVARRAWKTVETPDATLRVADSATFDADPDRLRQLFENLFRNAVEHGSTDSPSQAQENSVEHGSTSSRPAADDSVEHGSTSSQPSTDDSEPTETDDGLVVTVGTLAKGEGFFVADDGPGIPASERSRIFERGYTDSDDGTGFGLHIVREIVDAHRWNISVTDSDYGGARFEIDGV
ncbi:histidine kinase [Haloterrigena turkmenica DSM 5511]|uniref:histidine kinase n=1 Tax=Haloterrigena turkmenica (strain ATCC 51198 / DSM 5511 / JCM 9101 / NCIMB 13204 / VKM B-1734 / 4k) TaxID=543526 RepID=D2RRQ3_HALTV|nr:HAMP domain-containing sensor histidine kinase [Haloterrigena turkmenica]ADB62520.1 histidine kinase [Haloterrigena turkmenica DSM 5511]